MNKFKGTEGTEIGDYGIIFIKDLEPSITTGGQKKRYSTFKCSCGVFFNHRMCSVKNGRKKDCGCGVSSNRQIHGLTGSKIRMCWGHIKNRCYKSSSKAYKYYGARGITMYEPWLHDFKAFYDYTFSLPNYDICMTLDRIENNGNYEPGNLRWVTMKIQNSNRRPRTKSRKK